MSSNDYLTLIQHFKHKMQNTNRQIGRFRFKFNRQFFFLTWPKQSQHGALTYTYLFVSLRHWSSFFFVAGWQTFGISLAWVEHLRALFQFWSDNILHCHLDWGKLKRPFLLYKVLVESFSTNLTWFLFPTVFRVFNHWHDCMVAVGLGLEWGTIVRPECLTYDLQ